MIRLLAFAAALAAAALPAAAQVRIGLMVSATGPTTAIGIPQKIGCQGVFNMIGTNHSGMDARARVLVTVKDGKFRLLPV